MQNPSLFGLGLHPTRSVRAQLHAGVVRRAHKGLRQTKVQAAAPRTGRSGGARSPVLGALAGLVLSTALSACGTPGQDGDCGPFLSSAECQVVRVQLGLLDRRPPPDPTNRFGRCVNDGSAECILEDAAVVLGQRLFFDRCLSLGNNVACVTCHQPGQAFTDDRVRPITTPPTKFTVAGVEQLLSLPLIVNPTPERVTIPPPMVQAQLDEAGNPLANWNASKGMWEAVLRRPLASLGSSKGTPPATARHSPTLYNIAYGGGFAPAHGERTYGVTWTPWDGRYDSAWALVADVLEFGGTQSTDRSHVAVRIGQKHRQAYEQMIGGPLFDFNSKGLASDGTMKYVYPRHGSPGGNACWYSGKESDCGGTSLVPTDAVRNDINEVFVNAGKALGAYMRRLRSADSPYDRWLAGDPQAMSGAAQRGLRLFIGKAECIMCHNGPNFTDWRFHNLGIPAADPEQRVAGSVLPSPPDDRTNCFDGLAPGVVCADPGRHGWQLRTAGLCAEDSVSISGRTIRCQPVDMPPPNTRHDIPMDCTSTASDATDKVAQCLPAAMVDAAKCYYPSQAACEGDALCQWAPGKMRCIAKATPAELGQFKTPSLRNVAMTFPFMHNGMLSNYGPAERGETNVDDPTPHLIRVVEFYNGGGGKPDIGTLDPQIHPLHLSSTEISDLVEFLKALTDNSLATSSSPLSLSPDDLLDTGDCTDL